MHYEMSTKIVQAIYNLFTHLEFIECILSMLATFLIPDGLVLLWLSIFSILVLGRIPTLLYTGLVLVFPSSVSFTRSSKLGLDDEFRPETELTELIRLIPSFAD